LSPVQVVVADTGPLNYLIQINAIDLLPRLFDRIIVPISVRDELSHPNTPAVVRDWIAQSPLWFEVRPDPDHQDTVPASLDDGERATVALAMELNADLILMDDRDGVSFARGQGFAVTGTLGILDLAARRGLINLREAFMLLKDTSFHYRQGLLDALLAQQPQAEE
jgi:predicted nucleic acid-binding protein